MSFTAWLRSWVGHLNTVTMRAGASLTLVAVVVIAVGGSADAATTRAAASVHDYDARTSSRVAAHGDSGAEDSSGVAAARRIAAVGEGPPSRARRSTLPGGSSFATEAAGVAEAGLPSASQLADDVASATGGTIKELPSGYSVAVPNGGRGIVVRVMESGGGRTNYYRVSIPGKEAFTVEGAASVDRALTHIDISANSLEEILQIIKGAGG